MGRADPGQPQPGCTAGPAPGHPSPGTALPSGGNGDVSTRGTGSSVFRQWERVESTGTGPGRERRAFLSPGGVCPRVARREGDAHRHGRCWSSPHHAGKSSSLLLMLGQPPAGSKGHFVALSSCLFLPLGFPSLLFQIVFC